MLVLIAVFIFIAAEGEAKYGSGARGGKRAVARIMLR